MIDAKLLLADLTRLLKRLEDDLRERALSPTSDVPALRAQLQAEWQTARDAERTAETFESWAEQIITQAGVHWLLSCVFLRFIEDNGLVERPWLCGTPQSGRLALARDRHDAYFREHPHESDRDYLIACFREAGALPGLHTFFDDAHNPVFRLGISGDAAMLVMQFWQEISADSGVLVRDFTDSSWNTRFLGDLYQELSEATRKRYALLQTPEFVEEFILDRTLTPAIREFGYREVRMIDPTCGSGHFLLGGFRRMVDEWTRNEPGRNRRDIAQKALDAVAGVDLNPFAVAIARFRLLVAALQASDIHRMSDAPDFNIHLAIGDSLLHGKRFGLTATDDMFQRSEDFVGTGLAHAYASEDLVSVQTILGRQYHAVVGNPPYIVVPDAALNATYRNHYGSCHGQYSLGAPFTERFFELALTGGGSGPSRQAGFVGLITTNSFMKREFGTKLIKSVLPRLDLTHVIDTSGAYIPGHGTPTVILFGRHRAPVSSVIRTVRGVKGEPAPPEDPTKGLVWGSIIKVVDIANSETEYVSSDDTPREIFATHPWNIGGGGATNLAAAIGLVSLKRLSAVAEVYGGTGRTSADDVLIAPERSLKRNGVDEVAILPLVEGDQIRDWQISPGDFIVTPYTNEGLTPISSLPGVSRWLWRARTNLGNRVTFGKQSYFEDGRAWWGWHQINVNRLSYQYVISFAFVATHNHAVLDRGGKVFKQSAQVIRLPANATETDYLGLLGLLNSSTACFWLKQISFNKGDSTDANGARTTGDAAFDTYEFAATKLGQFPLSEKRPSQIAKTIDTLTRQLRAIFPATLIADFDAGRSVAPTRATLSSARAEADRIFRQMVAYQEELDWHCYSFYNLLPCDSDVDYLAGDATIAIAPGQRAFEIILARRIASGGEKTTWFERNCSNPVCEIPGHWPEEYQRVVQARIDLIERDPNFGLIERGEYKRRWNLPSWELLEKAALRDWLLVRLESPCYWATTAHQLPQLKSTSRIAEMARQDADFMQIAELYAGYADFNPAQLVADLIASESVPFLPVLRYTESGVRKRVQWEETWALQRREDAGENVGKIPVPPKYQVKDFLSSDFWRLRGGLDAPKERWISYPGCESGADGSLVVAWAGWSEVQQATALATYFIDMKEREGWGRERLQPLLAGLLELIPWLKQWHNDMDSDFGARMGDYYESFVADEARALQFTLDDLRVWKPLATAAKRGRKKAA
ncbi:MAG TPA: BREX-2 system adenine-specific DNA-methyltransferase PglX [Burkholderiaceae bacterium]|nr:BREX-2 system adenine-specific DNA-methyltransferase PglX [Burkholderiaceae bacterium]